MIRLQSVCKSYGGQRVVDNLSLEIPSRQTLCLIGSSGSGKTTTLRMLNRLVEPDSGQITVDGRDITEFDKVRLRRNAGYVIQQIGLLPHLSVGRNIALMLEAEGWHPDKIKAHVRNLLEWVQLDPELATRRPRELSGGQQQRVGVARALALSPGLLLLDEPFAALDPLTRIQLQDTFLRLQRQMGFMAVLVTHDLAEAFKCGDRIALLEGGRLLQCGTPLEILTRPANDYVARFVRGQTAEQLLDLPVSRLAGPVPSEAWEVTDDGLAWRGPDGELHYPPLLAPDTPLRQAIRQLLGSPWPGLPLSEASVDVNDDLEPAKTSGGEAGRFLSLDAIRRLL